MRRYHDHMTDAELAVLTHELECLDLAYADADAERLRNRHEWPLPEDFEDEYETLTKAALSRGRA